MQKKYKFSVRVGVLLKTIRHKAIMASPGCILCQDVLVYYLASSIIRIENIFIGCTLCSYLDTAMKYLYLNVLHH